MAIRVPIFFNTNSRKPLGRWPKGKAIIHKLSINKIV